MSGLNRDDIIRMAKEAGGYIPEQYPDELRIDTDDIVHFANLIAAVIDNKYPIKFTHEEYNAVIDAAVADGAKMERERIAKQFDSGVVNVRARGQSKPEQLYRPFGLAVEANLKEKNT
jgi:hypothetical protein